MDFLSWIVMTKLAFFLLFCFSSFTLFTFFCHFLLLIVYVAEHRLFKRFTQSFDVWTNRVSLCWIKNSHPRRFSKWTAGGKKRLFIYKTSYHSVSIEKYNILRQKRVKWKSQQYNARLLWIRLLRSRISSSIYVKTLEIRHTNYGK